MSRGVSQIKKCIDQCEGCFGNKDGNCVILNIVEEGCRFYKTVQQYEEEKKQ
jgi:hypothetical protein